MPRYKGYGKHTTNDYLDISVSRFNRWGYLKQGTCMTGTMSWKRNGVQTSSMAFAIDANNTRVTLSFSSKQQSYTHHIRLIKTPCNYGGFRYWLYCQKCMKKKGKLYCASNNNFYCRICLDLTYESKLISKRYRLYDKLFGRDMISDQIYALKKKYYRGRPTKKHRQLLRKQSSCVGGFAEALSIGNSSISTLLSF